MKRNFFQWKINLILFMIGVRYKYIKYNQAKKYNQGENINMTMWKI